MRTLLIRTVAERDSVRSAAQAETGNESASDRFGMPPHLRDEDVRTIAIAQEPAGFRSRLAGRELRMKCDNLLRARPNYPVYLDWAGIGICSTSFADELVGRLFVELGPMSFSARIRHRNMAPTVQAIVDTAVMQRVAQQLAGKG
ncbi:MAG: STAS-like domain-containing protein [Deltaproteobacteria bacterium]|nr:STAS-like domain-containing protein [Deltaproteobacteria bacterium]